MKQKVLKSLMLIALLLTSNAVWAYNFESGGIYYYLDGNNTATVISRDGNYNSYTGDIVIPETVTKEDVTYSVTSIGNRAFYKCSGLTSVTIPNSVTSIGEYAFYGCSGLTSVTIPNTVTSIESSAFEGCSSLTSVTIPNTVTSIGNFAFAKCSGLTSVTIPNSVTSIGGGAFYGCSGLTSVTIPNSVTSIGGNAFSECSGLTSVTIPNSVTSIESSAFKGCSSLTSVTIPNSVTSIESSVFEGCSSLTSVTIPNTVTSIGNRAFYKCSGLTSVTISNLVTSIGEYAFYYCDGLTSVTIGNSVTSIGNYAFYECSGLTSVTIPNSVTSIGNDAFAKCSGLTSVTIPNSITSIGGSAFSGCSGLTSVTIPNSVTSIGNSAFSACKGLTSVTIPNSVTNIGYYAFHYCYGLTSVTFESTTPPTIRENAFYGVSAMFKTPSLISVLAYKAIEELKDKTFAGHKVDGIYYLPTSETEVEVTFKDNNYNSYAGDVVIPAEITVDDKKYKVTSIGNYAFYNCSGLTSVTFESTTAPAIEEYAFTNTSPTIKTPFASVLAYKALNELKSKTFAGHEVDGIYYLPTSETEVEVTFKDNNYNSYAGDVVIPAEITVDEKKYNVTSIGNRAFRDCSGLTSVTIQNSVTSIGHYAFSECRGLTSVTIGNSVTSIGNRAFYNCSGLTSVTIPNTVTSIGNYAFGINYDSNNYQYITRTIKCNAKTPPALGNYVFSYNDYLTLEVPFESILAYQTIEGWSKNSYGSFTYKSKEVDGIYYMPTSDTEVEVTYKDNNYNSYIGEVIIPTEITVDDKKYSVTSIGDNAFCYCKGLTSVTIPNSVTSIGDCALYKCTGLTSVTIPNSVTSIGGGAFSGCSGLTSVTIPNSVTSIGGCAFENCSGLTSVTIPNSVTSIGNSAFYSCTGLTSVTIPNSVTSIGGCAFENCSGLTSVTIPNSVTSIGNSAFYSCTGLTSVTIPNSVTSIGGSTFYNCSSLTSVTIPNSVTSIGSSAFSNCSSLTSVTIPNSVTSIGSSAFSNCYLSTIECNATIPPACSGEYVFNGSSLALLKVPFESVVAYKSADIWKNFTYYAGTEIEGVYYVPTSETEVAVTYKDKNFNCYETSVDIPSTITVNEKTYNVTSIGDYAFRYCNELEGLLELPSSITSIGSSALYGTKYTICNVGAAVPPTIVSTSLPSTISLVLVPTGSRDTYKAAEVWETYKTSIVEKGSCDIEVTVKEGEDETLDDAIWYQTDASNAYITGLKVHGTLSQEDFELIKTNMTSLLDLDISDTDVTEIPAEIFKDKPTLMKIKLPNGLKSIGDYAFSGCKVLTNELVIPETVETIGSYAFQNCVSIDNILVIPASVKSIGNYAFSGCTQIDILDMSCATSLESINDHAFSGCTSLESVKFSTVLKSIGSYVFYNCKKLDNFTLPASLESIYSYAFNGCTSLTTLNFESCKSLTCIDNYTFSGCTSLENIKFPTSLETIGSYAFQNCRNITTLDFAGCELLTSINSTSFNGCTGLNVLNMVDCTSLTTINSNSFSTCTSLKTVNFPSSLASVGEKAFANCEQLMNISVPCETPPAIDANAEPFYGVDNIECILTYPTSLMRDYYKANYWGAFIKRDVKTNIDVEVEKPEDDTTGDDTTEEEEDNENQFGGGHKPGYGGHIWYDKDWHKHHKHPGKPSRAKSIGGIKLLDETTEPIVPTTDVSGIKGFVEDGLSMYVQNGDSVTFLIQPEAGYVIESVSYGGEDVTTQIVDGVFITPAVSGKNIKLQVSFAKETANVLLGDVNGDGEVNVTDITTLISYILGNTEGVNSAEVDINNDGEVNVTDVTTLISIILGTN